MDPQHIVTPDADDRNREGTDGCKPAESRDERRQRKPFVIFGAVFRVIGALFFSTPPRSYPHAARNTEAPSHSMHCEPGIPTFKEALLLNIVRLEQKPGCGALGRAILTSMEQPGISLFLKGCKIRIADDQGFFKAAAAFNQLEMVLQQGLRELSHWQYCR